MKKVLLVLLLLPMFLFTTELDASNGESRFIKSIGRGIDLVNGNLDSEKYEMPILQETYFENYPIFTENRSSSDDDFIVTNTYSNVESFMSTTFSISGSLGGTYKAFIGSLAADFSETLTTTISSYESQYYYYAYKISERYIAYMQDVGINNHVLKSNLHPTYIAYLGELDSGNLSYSQFFKLYGTHLIRSAVFGGKMESATGVYSNEIAVGSTYMSSITSNVSAVVQFTADANINTSSAVASALSSHSGTYNMVSKTSTTGGSSVSNPVQWFDSLNDSNSRMVSLTSNSLIPLWDMLPTEYSHLSTQMRTAFNEYYAEVNDDITNKTKLPIVTERTVVSNSSDTYTITDSGRFNQEYDIITLDNLFRTPVNELIELGYNKIKVQVYMQYGEKDDGYQYVYIYNGTNNSSSLVQQFDLEHSPGKIDKSFKSTYLFSDMHDISKFANNLIIIRFGANGNGADTWYTRNRTYTITIYKQ